MEKKAWFATWFDSPYYHLLYRHRSTDEAAAFVKRLTHYLNLPPQTPVLDLACGKGRHSEALYQAGLSVTGVDLSPNSIQAAREAYPQCSFEVADMRDFELHTTFGAVFNLFTSFGYFDDVADNRRVLQQVRKHLLPGGKLIIDFLHLPWVKANLVTQEEQVLDAVHFHIRREVTGTHIYKHIDLQDGATSLSFSERVQAIGPTHFREMLESVGFNVEEEFGDYMLNPVNADSKRFIIIATKLQ